MSQGTESLSTLRLTSQKRSLAATYASCSSRRTSHSKSPPRSCGSAPRVSTSPLSVSPYTRLEDRVLLDFLQVIPFKGAEDYQVRVRNKEQAEQEIRRNKVAWNGEWYVAYGGRPWSEARKYGFVSAGGHSPSGRLYSRGLFRLPVGSRIWVHAPGMGYLGVAEVTAPPVPFVDFEVSVDGTLSRYADVTHHDGWLGPEQGEATEFFVAVRWLDSVSVESEAFNEAGLFGNQNIVAQPQDPKWVRTVERLKERFPKWTVGV